MKKKFLPVLLAAVFALAGCDRGESTKFGSDQPLTSDIAAANPPSLPEESESENTITVTGKPLSPDQLVDFEPDYEWAKEYVINGMSGDFLDSLDDPAFKELYCRALALVRLRSTDNLVLADRITAQDYDERAKLSMEEQYGYYMESGYTYDSFRNAFYSVFTKETAGRIFERCPYFYSYNNEMWFASTSAGGNAGEVFQEYELINQTDTKLEFKRISYSVDIGEPISDYDPAKKDEYNKTEVEFRFVKTADGWKVEKFLDATDL